MRKLFFLWVFGFITAANADDVDIRIILAPRVTAEAMKKNLDPGTLSQENFDQAYSRASTSKQLEELFRFNKSNFKDKQSFVLQSAGAAGGNPSENWETAIEMIVTCSPSSCQLAFVRQTHPPKDGKMPPYGILKSVSCTDIEYNTWQVIDETTFGGKVLQTLIQVVKTEAPSENSTVPRMVADGYFISLPSGTAKTIEGKSSEELAAMIQKAISNNLPVNSFRIGANPGQRTTHQKGSLENASYDAGGLRETEGSYIEIEVSPDSAGSINWRCAGQLLQSQTGSKPQSLGFPPTEFAPAGQWKAVVSNQGPKNEYPVLIINIHDISKK